MNKIIDIKPDDRILISRSDRLGDLILALPFVETMKLRYPESQIEVMASLYASPILENNDRVDNIIRVQNDQLAIDKPYKKDLLHRLTQRNYRVVIVLYPERRISQMYYKAKIPARIGTAGRFHSVFYNLHLFHSRKNNLKHEFEFNLDFLQFFCQGKTITEPRVYLRRKEIDFARKILTRAGINGNFIILHPGSGGSAERWPVDRFIRLYRRLVRSGLNVVITGSDREGKMIDDICNRLNTTVIKITGETDLRTLAGVLSLASVVVANSTGPLHVATAVGTRVVGLYSGKDVMSPKRWGPLGENHRVIQPTTNECQCPPRQCRCMETITVDQVTDEVLSLYKTINTGKIIR